MLARSREQRKGLRRFTRRAATLTFADQKPSVDCVIWDISGSGARLAVELPLSELPHRFILTDTEIGSVPKHCELLWIDRRFVGVKFTGHVP
jgi:hypothetical protein